MIVALTWSGMFPTGDRPNNPARNAPSPKLSRAATVTELVGLAPKLAGLFGITHSVLLVAG